MCYVYIGFWVNLGWAVEIELLQGAQLSAAEEEQQLLQLGCDGPSKG